MSLSNAQRQVTESIARNRVVAAGRRFGKTYLAIREMAKVARLPNKRVWYVSPSYRMSKQIAWALLKEKLIEVRWAEKFNEQDLTAILRNKSTISLRGADNPDSLRGVGLDFLVMDEAADIKPEAWFSVLRPTLSDTGGSALFLGTPKGFNWFHKLWDQGQQEKEGWQSWQFTTLDGGNVSEEEIESSRRDLDELTFNAEYLATFLNFSGRAYYSFQRSTHCRKLEYDPKQPVMFCFDFNWQPGVAAVTQEQKLPNGLQGTGVIGEVWIPRNSNTIAVCKKLLTDWKDHQGRIICYGDATGGARGSAKIAGSDWDLIRQTLKHGADGIKGFGDRVIYRVPKANPPERARINAMNSRLKNGAGEIRLMVDQVKAPHVVTDLEGVRLLEGGSGELDKKHDPDLTHISDSLGYYVNHEFPVVKATATQTRIKGLY